MTPEQLAAITDIEALRAAALAMVDSQLQRIAERDRCIESQTQELAERTAALTERDQRIASQQRQIQTLDLTVQHLNHEVARLKRIQFGAKTEALSALQRELFADTVAEELAAAEQAAPGRAARISGGARSPMKRCCPWSNQALVATQGRCCTAFAAASKVAPARLGRCPCASMPTTPGSCVGASEMSRKIPAQRRVSGGLLRHQRELQASAPQHPFAAVITAAAIECRAPARRSRTAVTGSGAVPSTGRHLSASRLLDPAWPRPSASRARSPGSAGCRPN